MRKLNLKKESLTDLASEELAAVAGGVTIGCTMTLNVLCLYARLERLTIGSLDCTQVTTR